MQTEVRNCGLLSQTSMLHLHGFNYKHIPHLNAFQCHGRLSTGVVAAKVQNNTNYGKMGRAYAVAKYIYGISHPCTHTQTHTHTQTIMHRQTCMHTRTHAHERQREREREREREIERERER